MLFYLVFLNVNIYIFNTTIVMIDDKKIEEEAVKSTNYLKGICDFTVINASEEGFKAGAKWAINEFLKEMWHDVFKENIPRGKMVIVEYTYKGGIYYRSLKIPDDIQWARGFFNEKRLRRWVYVEDLFPKEGGEQ